MRFIGSPPARFFAPRPAGMPLLRMQWRNLLFMHWPVSPAMLRPLVPDCFDIDVFDDRAWIGLVPFTMRCVQPWVVPPVPGIADLRAITAFHECNVRTYIRPRQGGMPGVWFFSLDAASRLAVWGAQRFFHLPYYYARMEIDRQGNEFAYRTTRVERPSASMRCSWTAGRALPFSGPGDLTHFLTERYCLYTVDRRNHPRRCRIWHQPWPLRHAALTCLEDGLVASAGISVDDSKPLLHHADLGAGAARRNGDGQRQRPQALITASRSMTFTTRSPVTSAG